MPYRKIGELLDISFGRVRQIIDGTTDGPAKRKSKEADAGTSAGPMIHPGT
ncbi:hypothetical protein [Streptomyces sp. NPDC048442]|uniref:hypothetical protein n=1 Tax=Streptomyces sp. NPDC048442 TaxID=3154823 RepID=UPI00341ACF2F